MIATVFLDWLLSFGTGTLFAIAGHAEVAGAQHRLRARAFRWGMLYLHLGILSISLALYAVERDWMWMYWVDARALPAAIQVLAFALYEVCFIAGFFLAAELQRRAAWLIAAATAAAITTLEVAARTRLLRFGSLAEFQAGTAAPAIDLDPVRVQPEWLLVSVAGVASLGVLAFMLWRLHKMSPRSSVVTP